MTFSPQYIHCKGTIELFPYLNFIEFWVNLVFRPSQYLMVYEKLETMSEQEILNGKMPINYFINKSFENSRQFCIFLIVLSKYILSSLK